MTELKIDEEYKSLIPPPSNEELRSLEESLLEEGCREPITIWHSTIVDGHNRYMLCKKHGIPFTTRNIYFKNRQEAIIWICMTQLARRNISDEVRRYLIGKRYEMEKILGAHNAYGANQYKGKEVRSQNETEAKYEPTETRTRERLSAEYHLASATIGRYGQYAQAIDFLQDTVPDIAEKILNGRLKVNQKIVVALAELPISELLKIRDAIEKSGGGFIPYSYARSLVQYKDEREALKLPETAGAIKEMPAFDPDAEIRSLTLTIPSWERSIERIIEPGRIRMASDAAKKDLSGALQSLLRMTVRVLDAVKEKELYE